MRKFKHVETGNIATETHSEKNYKVSYPQNYTIPKWIIENSKDWIEIFEPKFKNGDVVKIIDEYGVSMILLTDAKNGIGYGLINDNWYEKKQVNLQGFLWQLATQDEWLEALTKKAVKNGFKEGCIANNSKIHRYKLSDYKFEKGYFKLNNNVLVWVNETDNETDYWTLMEDGIWAEVVKDETLEELAESFRKHVVKSCTGYGADFISFFTENKETIHRLSK